MTIQHASRPSITIRNRKKDVLWGLITLTISEFVLLKYWVIAFKRGDQYYEITVPKGFVCDLASIPRILWWLISSHELGTAPILHDYLYKKKGKILYTHRVSPHHSRTISSGFTRKESDKLWSALMRQQRVGPYQRFVSYWAVRLFGWTYWRW